MSVALGAVALSQWEATLDVAARVREHLATYPEAGVPARRAMVEKLLVAAERCDALARSGYHGGWSGRSGAVASCVYLSSAALAMYTGDDATLAALREEIERAARGN